MYGIIAGLAKIQSTLNSGKTLNYNANNVRIVEPCECFLYLQHIADEMGLKVEVMVELSTYAPSVNPKLKVN